MDISKDRRKNSPKEIRSKTTGDKKVGILFSGGTDSTYAAWTQIPKFDKIYLITFVRHGFRNPTNVEEAVYRLRKAATDKDIIHEFVDFEDIYQKITPHEEKWQVQKEVLQQKIGPLWEDRHGVKKGREAYVKKRNKLFMANECLQCKIAMHIAAIKYCLERKIFNLCDGSNEEQLDDGTQIEDVKMVASEIFRHLGINYYSPIFNSHPDERCKALYEAGITDHRDHKRLEKTHQIPSRQIQCTIPSAALWTVCIFRWLVYDGQSCGEYIEMCRQYYTQEMEKGLYMFNLI